MSDTMLLGVLRMPIADGESTLTLRQFINRARQAADRIEADAARIAELEAQLQEAITHLREMTTVPDLNAVKQARRWLDSTAIKATGGTT